MGQVQAQELQGETTEPRHRIRAPPSGQDIYQLTSHRGREGDYQPLPLIHPDDLALKENIGWGASGVTKRCQWNDGSDAAVKLFFPGNRTEEDLRAELQQWCGTMHDNIVQVKAASLTTGHLCVVMELLPEGSLKGFLHSSTKGHRPANWPLLYRIAIDLSKALLYLHSASGRLHRNLSPDSVLLQSLDFLSPDPVAKLHDFRECRLIPEGKGKPVHSIVNYMAPEVLSGGPYTTKSDVYSFGVLLCEMITRQKPFHEEVNTRRIAELVKKGDRPILPDFCPPSVSQLIEACWAADPSRRPSFLEILRSLSTLGKMWDDLQVDQILADVGFESTDTEAPSSHVRAWEETTLTDIEDIPTTPLRGSLRDSDAEDEQEIGSPRSRFSSSKARGAKAESPQIIKRVRRAITEDSPSPRRKKRFPLPVSSPAARQSPDTKKRIRKVRTLPRNVPASGSGALGRRKRKESSGLSQGTREIKDDLSLVLDQNIELEGSPMLSGRNLTPEHLKELSKARSNLHQLLTAESNNYQESQYGLVVQVLRASLHRETERVNTYKIENEMLGLQYRQEAKHRRLLEQKLRDTKKDLYRRSLRLTSIAGVLKSEPGSPVSIPNSPSISFSDTEDDSREESSAQQESESTIQWSEIPFEALQCESRPYCFSSFAIWYKAQWKSLPVRFCVLIGSVYPELLTKFRKLSTVIQQLTNHPNICNMVGVVSKAPNFGVVMCVPPNAIELRELMSRGALSYRHKLLILRSIAAAVDHCHSHSRSVSWLNNRSVYVDPETMQTQLIHACHLFYFSQRLDMEWERFRWQAPEVFFGQNNSTSQQADMFTIGILIWYMVAEREPYEETFGPDTAEQLLAGWRLPPPSGCPPPLVELMNGCWKKVPAERLGADLVAKRLHELLLDLPAEDNE